MPRTHLGIKRFDFKKGFPRLFLHEKHERVVRWVIRSITGVGIATSVLTMPWYWGLTVSILLLGIDVFLERTLFYYSSLYVDSLMLDYDPDEWEATVFVSLGEPSDPASKKIVGLAFKTEDYARKFFETLHRWNGSPDHRQQDLRLTFVIDEFRYFVYLYSDIEKDRFKQFRTQVEDENKLAKYGKEHFAIYMNTTICKSFSTKGNFALGMFLDNNPPGKEFLLAPYIVKNGGVEAVGGVDPILMKDYKRKIPFELTQDDYEYYHWQRVVAKSA